MFWFLFPSLRFVNAYTTAMLTLPIERRGGAMADPNHTMVCALALRQNELENRKSGHRIFCISHHFSLNLYMTFDRLLAVFPYIFSSSSSSSSSSYAKPRISSQIASCLASLSYKKIVSRILRIAQSTSLP